MYFNVSQREYINVKFSKSNLISLNWKKVSTPIKYLYSILTYDALKINIQNLLD